MNNKNKITKKPFIFERKIGNIDVEFNVQAYYMAGGLLKTSTAMQRTCKQEIKDDNNFKTTGENDYTTSLKELLYTLDIFIKETKQKGNKKVIEPTDFNQANPQELTLYLFWQIRHILTHSGETIDDDCHNKYKQIYDNAKLQNISPSLDIHPNDLNVNEILIVSHEQYAHIKECLYDYAKVRVSDEQFVALYKLGHIAYGKGELSFITSVEMDFKVYEFNVEDAHESGFNIEYARRYKSLPKDAHYDSKQEKIILNNGKSFSARRIRKNFEPLL